MSTKKYVLGAAALVVIVSAVVVALSCSNEGTTSPDANYSRAIAILGHVYLGQTQIPVYGVEVTWFCDEHEPPVELGSWTTNFSGSYAISHDWGTTHDGHDMYGSAEKDGYKTNYNKVYDFDSGSIPYTRDFHMYLLP
jgi:hypothetical protein